MVVRNGFAHLRRDGTDLRRGEAREFGAVGQAGVGELDEIARRCRGQQLGDAFATVDVANHGVETSFVSFSMSVLSGRGSSGEPISMTTRTASPRIHALL